MIIDTSLEPAPRTPQTRTFRRSGRLVGFTPDQSRRQNELIRAAWDGLKTKEAVIAFLNSHNDVLGGKPLGMALVSEEGFRVAELALRTQVAKGIS
jgi:hypothetical protein